MKHRPTNGKCSDFVKVLTIRITEQDMERIKTIAGEYGGNKSEAVRTALALVAHSIIADNKYASEHGYERREDIEE